MFARALLLTLTLMPPAFAQPGLYGPITTRVKAGDLAPALTFTKILITPAAAGDSQPTLTGKLTVLAFYPDTTHNLQSVSLWNAAVQQFTGKPVQFVWITGEREATLLPWLTQHPIAGYVLHDPVGQTGNAYALETPENVLIGPDGKILGFFQGIQEIPRFVAAVQTNHITTTRPDRTTIQSFLQSGLVLLDPEPRRMPRPDDHKPAFPPSETVHITASLGEDRGNFSADDWLSLQGYTLPEALEYLYGVNPIRVRLPATLDPGLHYNLALVLPKPESTEQKKDRLKRAIAEHFRLTIRRETQLADVYAVTVTPGRQPLLHQPPTPTAPTAFLSHSEVEYESRRTPGELPQTQGPAALTEISGLSIEGTLDDLCHTLEATLDRPVVNQTRLEGVAHFNLPGSRTGPNDFLDRLHDQYGLLITPTQSPVELFVLTLQ